MISINRNKTHFKLHFSLKNKTNCNDVRNAVKSTLLVVKGLPHEDIAMQHDEIQQALTHPVVK